MKSAFKTGMERCLSPAEGRARVWEGGDAARRRDGRGRKAVATGFTLVELLVVIAVIAILAAMLLPSLGKSKSRALAVQCLSNTKQLQTAWLMYAHDFNDRIVVNPGDGPASFGNVTQGWVDLDYGYADLSTVDGGYTNALTITQGLLWRYAGGQGVYRCPGQNQVYNFAGSGALLTAVPARSYSVSSRMNGGMDGPNLTLSGIAAPPPAQAFVFIDENLYTIEEGRFIVNPTNPEMWGDNSVVDSLDVPAARHGGVGTLSFADGHSELHLWVEPSTAAVDGSAIQGFNFPSYPGANGGANKDIQWVQARYLTTVTN